MNILYEDNHLLVVEKPVNVPVQRDATGDDDLLSLCREYIRVKYQKPGEAYLALVHRLDRPVGGVMVFGRTSKAAARLTAQFKSHEAKKRYVAIVEGTPAPQAELTGWLYKDEGTHSSAVVPEGTPGAKLARLSYQTLARRDGTALVDVSLDTGRPHQIRVQLAHAGLPSLGDQRYNARARPGTQIKLFSYALSLKHPTLGEDMTFFAAPAGDGWSAYPDALRLLPAFKVCRGVYEDGDMLVVDKNGGTEVETDLLPELRSLTDALYPVHRLDANTRGLVVFAKTERAREALEAKFRDHDLTKIYHAIVCGRPDPDEARLVHYGVKDADGAYMRLCPEGTDGAKRMALSYRVLASDGAHSLLEITLETGRTHQIRAQLAAIGCPVLGDDKYGDRAKNKAARCRTQQLLAKTLVIDGKTFESQRELTL